MKVEKIEKHMSQNTVVVGENGGTTTIGVIAQNDHTDVPVRIAGISVGDYAHGDYNWFAAKDTRKATATEIARFFAWLREDGRDIANGFERFGGRPPKGFEVAATTTEAAPETGRVYDRTAPEADIRALVGQMVEIIEATPSDHNGKIGRVLETSIDSYNVVRVEVEGVARGWWASKVRVVSAAPVAETKPALTQKARYEVGERVQLRAARSGESRISPTNFAPGASVTITAVTTNNGYTAEGPVLHMGGSIRTQVGLAHADIAGFVSVAAPTVAPGKVYNAGTPRAERDALVGKRVRYLDRDLAAGHTDIGVCTKVDGSTCPYRVTFGGGHSVWSRSVELVEAAPATKAKPAAKRLTVGDKAVAVYRSAPHIASIGTINRDDRDGLPYALAGIPNMFYEEHTFPLTVEGFRGAHAVQKAEGVVPENGDFVASIDNDGVVDAGVLRNGYIVLTCSEADPEALDGAVKLVGLENWSDRVVVLCRAPRI